jgi:hypothetical protein
MDPAFPDIVGEWAEQEVDDHAKVWTITRGTDGRLADQIDPSFLIHADDVQLPDGIVDALIAAAARRDIEDSRVW